MIEHLPRLISEKAKLLEEVGIERASGEVEMMLCYLLGVDRLSLYLHGSKLIKEEHLKQLDEIIEKRLTRYPLQLILKEAWFYGRKFYVTPDVMVPTPETEILCNAAIGFVNKHEIVKPNIIDLGVGSGVISVTLAKELQDCSILALDISEAALKVAKKNAIDLKAESKIKFLVSDYFEQVPEDNKYDLILANPPYITEDEYKSLPPEVLADPKISLTGGESGLDAVKKILKQAPNFLKKGGRIMFEIGYNQADKVTELTSSDERYKSIVILKDLNDIDRVIILGCDD